MAAMDDWDGMPTVQELMAGTPIADPTNDVKPITIGVQLRIVFKPCGMRMPISLRLMPTRTHGLWTAPKLRNATPVARRTCALSFWFHRVAMAVVDKVNSQRGTSLSRQHSD